MNKFALLLLFVGLSATVCGQHRLDTVGICVLLYPDGHAYVQEERTMYIGDQGTECYIKFHNMGDMKVSLESVTDESGTDYLVEPSWDIDRSRSQKAYRCGLNRTNEGVELCWGVGSSGHHKYKVCYELTDLVQSYTDADGFHHNFYEAADPPAKYGYVYVMLNHNAFGNDSISLSPDNARVWAFGFYGQVGFYAGCVAAYSKLQFDKGEKMIVTMEFPKGLFTPLRDAGRSFREVKENAFRHSTYNLDNDSNGTGQRTSFYGGDSEAAEYDTIDLILGSFCCCGMPVILILVGFIYWRRESKKKKARDKKLDDNLKRRRTSVPYVYEPPSEGRLVRSQLILLATLEEFRDWRGKPVSQDELLSALLLRLLYKGNIELIIDESRPNKLTAAFRISKPVDRKSIPSDDNFSSLFSDRRHARAALDLRLYANMATTPLNDMGFERELQWLLYEASGADHVLQPNELANYIRNEQNSLRLRPFAKLMSVLYFGNVDFKRCPKEEVNEVYGFYKYLRDFTILPERHIQEVAIWREFMVFAALFGMTKRVAKDLQRINPDLANLDQLTMRYLAEPIIQNTISSFSDNISSALSVAYNYRTEKERAVERAASSYRRSEYDRDSNYDRDSGRGGSSSYSGGSGYSGGGGSGVR